MTREHRFNGAGRRAAGATLACAALAMSLAGCGQPAQQPESQTDTAPAQEQAATEEVPAKEQAKSAVPNATFSTSGGLVDVAGKPVDADLGTDDAEEGAWSPVGVMAEDRLIVMKTDTDESLHFAVADGTGQIVADLDDTLSKYGTVDALDTGAMASFANGLAVLPLQVTAPSGETGFVSVMLEPDGSEAFSVGTVPGCTIEGHPGGAPQRFIDGERYLPNIDKIVDEDGEVVASPTKKVVIVGDGYYATVGHDRGKVYKNDGSLALDVETLSSDKYAFSFQSIKGVLGDDVLLLEAQEQSANGGASRTVTGLYNVDEGQWVVPPSEGLLEATPTFDDQIYVRAQSKDVLDGSYDRTSSGNDGYACIIDADGKVLFDLASSGIDGAGDGAFRAQYLSAGYWQVTSDSKDFAAQVIYIDDDGSYVGAEESSFTPAPGYKDLYQALSVE